MYIFIPSTKGAPQANWHLHRKPCLWCGGLPDDLLGAHSVNMLTFWLDLINEHLYNRASGKLSGREPCVDKIQNQMLAPLHYVNSRLYHTKEFFYITPGDKKSWCASSGFWEQWNVYNLVIILILGHLKSSCFKKKKNSLLLLLFHGDYNFTIWKFLN